MSDLGSMFMQAYGVTDITSPAMLVAIDNWFDLFYKDRPGCEQDPAQRLPCIIVDTIYEAAFSEYECGINVKSDKDKNIEEILNVFNEQKQDMFQWACIGGEGFIKPVPRNGKFEFSFISRHNFIVLERSSRGTITSIGISETTIKNEKNRCAYYTLLERRTSGNNLVIENKLFRSEQAGVLGKQVSLTTIPEYENLLPELALPIEGLGLIPMKMPIINTVEESLDGVSLYAAACEKIKAQYRHEQRINDEYELTRPSALVSDDVLPPEPRPGLDSVINEFVASREKPVIPKYIKAIFSVSSEEHPVTVYNPKPNQQELEARENQHLRHIENIIGLRRGVLSQAESEEFTATEIRSTSTKMAHLIAKLQKMWETAVREVIKICDSLGIVYLNWDKSVLPEPIIGWGNGILYDEQTEYDRLNTQVTLGRLKPEYLIAWLGIKPMDEKELTNAKELIPTLSDTKDFEE